VTSVPELLRVCVDKLLFYVLDDILRDFTDVIIHDSGVSQLILSCVDITKQVVF
jgi:hypothetical protein